MRSQRPSIRLTAVLATLTAILLVTDTRTVAQQETVLLSFNRKDGGQPIVPLIFDASGNLYGTTYLDANNWGTVFELTPKAGGGWTEKVLHNFNNNGTDGYHPQGGLVFDAAGNLYGTTYAGGAYNWGTVFELTPNARGGWTEKVLHDFNYNGRDGVEPVASLTFDAAGNLYGTTYAGGTHNHGTVFELTPKAGGGWTEKIPHDFNNNGKDGNYPTGGLISDAPGNLYGTTYQGGTYGYGTVFELTPAVGGKWSERVLHDFGNGTDGSEPFGVIFDAAGNLYGVTSWGGSGGCGNSVGCGTVFELTPTAGGGWTEKILHNFSWNGTDGYHPQATLIFDVSGNLYGTTYAGGTDDGGAAFELTPTTGGGWTEKVLHSFCSQSNCADGGTPVAGLIFDGVGNLYGTTWYGGAHGDGTVFEITP